jgi:hypothetical protein
MIRNETECQEAQMRRKLCPPAAKCRFAYVESDTLFAHSSDDKVDVRISLVCMQRHRVTTLKRESVHGERSHGGREFVGRGSLRHGEDEIVDELGRPSAIGDRSIRMPSLDIQVQIPIEHQIFLKSSVIQPLPHIGFDLAMPLSADIVKVGADALQRPSRRKL